MRHGAGPAESEQEQVEQEEGPDQAPADGVPEEDVPHARLRRCAFPLPNARPPNAARARVFPPPRTAARRAPRERPSPVPRVPFPQTSRAHRPSKNNPQRTKRINADIEVSTGGKAARGGQHFELGTISTSSKEVCADLRKESSKSRKQDRVRKAKEKAQAVASKNLADGS